MIGAVLVSSPRVCQDMAEPPTETEDVVVSAYRVYLHVFARRHSACVSEVSGLYVGEAGIGFLMG